LFTQMKKDKENDLGSRVYYSGRSGYEQTDTEPKGSAGIGQKSFRRAISDKPLAGGDPRGDHKKRRREGGRLGTFIHRN